MVLVLLALAVPVAFRLSSTLWVPLVLSAALQLLALSVGLRADFRAGRALAILLLIAALVGAVRLLTPWWPCSVACQGGEAYSAIAGVSVTLLGTLAASALALLAWWQRRREHASTVLRALLGLLAGGCLWFLIASVQLDLRCPFCLSFHALVLAALLVAVRWAWPGWWLVLGLLGLHAAFTWKLEPPAAQAPAAVATAAPASALQVRIDANRRIGVASAPLVLDEILDLRCEHCAATHAALLRALAADLAAGRFAIVVRQALLARDPLSTELAAWSYGAAAHSAGAYQTLVESVLGTHLANLAAYRARFSALASAPVDDATTAAVLAADRTFAKQAGFTGPVPFVRLRVGDHERAHWVGEVDAAAVGSAVASAVGAAVESARDR